jgi:hypothetical protein
MTEDFNANQSKLSILITFLGIKMIVEITTKVRVAKTITTALPTATMTR